MECAIQLHMSEGSEMRLCNLLVLPSSGLPKCCVHPAASLNNSQYSIPCKISYLTPTQNWL